MVRAATARIEQYAAVPIGASMGVISIFFVALLLPISFEAAGLRLSPLRLFVIVATLPLIVALCQGKAGRLLLADVLILGYSAWVVLSLVANHGMERLPYGLATASETAASWLLGRVFVRGPSQYRYIFTCGFLSLLLIFPAALYESLTGTVVVAELFGGVFDTPSRGGSSEQGRLGLERVYAVMGHPILFGLYCTLMLSNLLLVFEGAVYRRLAATALALVMTFMSLSSAPLLAAVLQIMLLVWWRLTKGAWWTLLILVVAAYVFVDIAANRSPLVLLISYATFSPHTGWIRIAQFNYGSQAALANPVFGIGLNTWPRPAWVSSSVDNFWLLTALRYGIPALFLLAAAILLHFAAIVRSSRIVGTVRRYRIGYLVSLVAVLFTLATVHIWDSAYALFVFLLGSGAWFYSADSESSADNIKPIHSTRSELTYSRSSTPDTDNNFSRTRSSDSTSRR